MLMVLPVCPAWPALSGVSPASSTRTSPPPTAGGLRGLSLPEGGQGGGAASAGRSPGAEQVRLLLLDEARRWSESDGADGPESEKGGDVARRVPGTRVTSPTGRGADVLRGRGPRFGRVRDELRTTGRTRAVAWRLATLSIAGGRRGEPRRRGRRQDRRQDGARQPSRRAAVRLGLQRGARGTTSARSTAVPTSSFTAVRPDDYKLRRFIT